MEREIKFRRAHFKDEEKKQFAFFTYWGFGVDIGVFTAPASVSNALYCTDQQLTGLKDNNGKEIYQGDKFDAGENDGSYYLIEWDNDLAGFSVNLYSYEMYHNEGGGEEFSSNITMIDKNIIGVIDLINDEIIGNIYETQLSQNPNKK